MRPIVHALKHFLVRIMVFILFVQRFVHCVNVNGCRVVNMIMTSSIILLMGTFSSGKVTHTRIKRTIQILLI